MWEAFFPRPGGEGPLPINSTPEMGPEEPFDPSLPEPRQEGLTDANAKAADRGAGLQGCREVGSAMGRGSVPLLCWSQGIGDFHCQVVVAA